MKTPTEKRKMIDRTDDILSIRRQCELVGLNRSTFYYAPNRESPFNLELMHMMDAHYLKHPYKGARRMHTWLTKDKGYKVNRKRIERLYYSVMGLRSILPGIHTSKAAPEYPVYPYLLRGLKIEKANQVWATDITYIPMYKGFLYLVAIMDLYSRYIVGWDLSNTMEASWCKDVLEFSVSVHGRPRILNTDQGSQFTSEIYRDYVLGEKIKFSMDGKGRATDNAFIESFWKTLKYEKIYPNPSENGTELYMQVEEFVYNYNHKRRHSSIDDKYPSQLYSSVLGEEKKRVYHIPTS